MWIVRLALRRPYTVAVLCVVIVVLGALAFSKMTVDIFPAIDIPVVIALFQYPGLSAEEMEKRVVIVNERGCSTTVNAIERIESTSIEGIGMIKVFFQPEATVAGGVAQINAISQTILRILPPGMQPPVIVQFNASNVPVAQVVSTHEATIPELRLRVEELQHSLAVLLGRNPGDAVDVRALDATRVPAELPGSVPSGLLQRRPDIRAQQDRVQAAAARVGVARALYFPDFTINLAVGAASISTGSLFLPASFAMDMLAAATVPLFRGGALEANLNANVAAYKQEIAAYQQTVLVAFQETQDAIARVQELTRERDRLLQAVTEEKGSLALANRSYDAGLSSYLEVLDAERSLLAARSSLTSVEGRRLIGMVSLYKSLGGGWQ